MLSSVPSLISSLTQRTRFTQRSWPCQKKPCAADPRSSRPLLARTPRGMCNNEFVRHTSPVDFYTGRYITEPGVPSLPLSLEGKGTTARIYIERDIQAGMTGCGGGAVEGARWLTKGLRCPTRASSLR